VGYFATATYWALIPLSRVMNVVNQVALPIFAKVRRETETLKHRQVMLPLQLILFFSTMLYGSLALVATPFVTLVIGSKWEPMAGLLAVFCIAMPLRAVLALLNSPLQANAHDATLLKMQSLHVAASWAGALLACQLPFQWLTPIHVTVAMTSTCIGIGIGMQALGLPLRSMAIVILKTAVSAAVATLAGILAGDALASNETWFVVVLSLMVFLTVFLTTLFAFERALYRQLIEAFTPERRARQRTRGIRKLLLAVLRGLGCFHFCRWLYRNKVLVVGYHGGAADTLHQYNGMLFMRSSTFEGRIALLSRLGYEYISLDQLLDCCQQREAAAGRRLAPRIVLTFDDGWDTTFTELIPHLKATGIPATVYLHTKPVLDDSPILNVAWSYRLWLEQAQPSGYPGSPLLPPMDQWPDGALKRWINQESNRRVGSRQNPFVDDDTLIRRMFTYANPDGLKRVATTGHISLEAHGHHHDLLNDSRYDLRANIKACLSDFTSLELRQPKHYCYPSGQYSSGSDQILECEGFRSGMTCDAGWVTPSVAINPYYLPRFLDSDHYSDVEFEAEVSGFLDLMRRLKRSMGGLDSH
jgi:peptidoglycan/xylan/chitin deacetylase (PgdA/CDA1 family)